MKEINCRISNVKCLEEDTLFIDIDSDERFMLEDFYELKQAALDLGKGKSFYNLINVGAFTIPDKDAREASCSISGSYYKKADAFIIHSLPQLLIGNLMIKINRPSVPTKFFRSLKDAENWIEELKKKAIQNLAY